MVDLLKQLQALAEDVSPDEAIMLINRGGWVRLKDMTNEDFVRFDKQDVVVGADNFSRFPYFRIMVDSDTRPYTFSTSGWSGNSGCDQFWFCLKSEFNGSLPDEISSHSPLPAGPLPPVRA